MTLPLVLAIAGCFALLVGLLGGGIKAKEIEVPKIPVWPRLFSGFIGITLIGVSIRLSVPDFWQTTGTPASTQVPPTEPVTSQPAGLKVFSFYNQFYHTEDEYPGVAFDIGKHVRVSGKTDFVTGYSRYVWYAICPQTTKQCTIKEIRLDTSGAWNIFIDIGGNGNDCVIFDVIFVVTNDATNEVFKTLDGISETKFEEQKFETHLPFAVRPVLDDFSQLTSICQTVSQ